MTVAATTTDTSARALASRLIGAKGRTLLLRQPTRIEIPSGPDAGLVVESPLSTATLAASGAFLAGVSTINLDAATVTGLLVAGDTFVVAGNAQVYTVTGDPYPAEGSALAGVTFTPALVANVADNAVVTVTFSGTDTQIKGFPTRARWRMVDGKLTRIGDWEILVSKLALDEAGITVRHGDLIFLGADSTADRARVLADEPIPSGELDAAVTFLLEAA